jgi:hypothetical protein
MLNTTQFIVNAISMLVFLSTNCSSRVCRLVYDISHIKSHTHCYKWFINHCQIDNNMVSCSYHFAFFPIFQKNCLNQSCIYLFNLSFKIYGPITELCYTSQNLQWHHTYIFDSMIFKVLCQNALPQHDLHT